MAEKVTKPAKPVVKPYGTNSANKVTPSTNNKTVVTASGGSGGGPYYDDEKNYYIAIPDHHMSKKFLIKKVIGQGTFGRVVNCYDTYTNQSCAVKVIRSLDKYRKAAEVEMEVLQYISTIDNKRQSGCVFMNDAIDFRNHICISFPLYGDSLFKVLQVRNFVGLPYEQTIDIIHQVLCAVEFLHSVRLIHTDLKPENILVKTGAMDLTTSPPTLVNSEIVIIDFSSAHWSDKRYSKEVSTRHYRAPEIILDMGWSFPCDLWSTGCIMFELLTGQVLFQTHENIQHLAMMEKVIGRFPLLWVELSSKKKLFLLDRVYKEGSGEEETQAVPLDWPNIAVNEKSAEYVNHYYHPLTHMLYPYLQVLPPNSPDIKKHGLKVSTEDEIKAQHKKIAFSEATEWLSVLQKLLVLRPHYRTKAEHLLGLPLFTSRLDSMQFTRRKLGYFSTSMERKEWLAEPDRLTAYLKVARPSVNSSNAIV